MTRTLALALAVGLGATACGRHGEPADKQPLPPPVAVTVAKARTAAVDTQYVATATLRGRNTAVVTSKGVGYVRALHVRPGDEVVAGQVLVELDTNDVAAGLVQARAGETEAVAGIDQAERDLEAARAARKLATLTYERTRRLAEQKAATPQELDEAEVAQTAAFARERMAEAGLARAQARTDQARAGVGMAKVAVGDRRVVAPFAGRVVSRAVELGNLASPGTPLLTLEEHDGLRAEAVVDESQTARIGLGDPVDVEIDSLEIRLKGRVGEIVPAVESTSRAFVVKVDLPESATAAAGANPPGAGLRPGMFARARFRVGEAQRLVIPAGAVSPRGQLDRVFVVEGDRARLRVVTVGQVQGGNVEVLSGLDDGETVVVAPPAGLGDAAPIQASPFAPESAPATPPPASGPAGRSSDDSAGIAPPSEVRR